MTIDHGTGKPGLVFAIENNGPYRVPSRIKPIAIAFTNSATLDLFLIGDPATSRVIALYRETSDDLAAIKMIGEVGARSYAWMAKFFKRLFGGSVEHFLLRIERFFVRRTKKRSIRRSF